MDDSPSPSHQAIIEKIHAHLVKEYIVRLLKKKVSLKTPAQQQNLAQSVSKNAADLEAFCTSNVPKPSPVFHHPSMYRWLEKEQA
ncbi:tumor necrosis factor alpha-induced protein hypothetical protein [Limosa lapponica baueri]|uniref:Uncharacterized protein n=1 Tax=Limosa lapponica baueri TaxID=1758121 RepID=A0A2I0TI15_LIMLA|nr:tumor necrosis factor alpha-induced protein hypothetical protein [Limosa lapponica baueri]